MPQKIVKFEGKTYSVPNDATLDEIDTLISGKPQAAATGPSVPAKGVDDPTANMGARDLMNSLLGEFEITALDPFSARGPEDASGKAPWRVPPILQGLFGFAKTGLKMGTNPVEALPEVASTAKGAAVAPTQFVSDLASDDPRTRAQAPGHFITQTAPAVLGAGQLMKGAASAMPNAARAGKVFQDIKTKAANLPVDTTQAQAVLDRANQLARSGSTKPSVLTKFDRRVMGTKGQGNPPLTYPESFDFASKAKQLSAAEKMASDPAMSAQVDRFAQALQKGNRQVAESIGMGRQFDAAMKEYRNAMRVEGAVEFAKKHGLKAALTGTALILAEKYFGVR